MHAASDRSSRARVRSSTSTSRSTTRSSVASSRRTTAPSLARRPSPRRALKRTIPSGSWLGGDLEEERHGGRSGGEKRLIDRGHVDSHEGRARRMIVDWRVRARRARARRSQPPAARRAGVARGPVREHEEQRTPTASGDGVGLHGARDLDLDVERRPVLGERAAPREVGAGCASSPRARRSARCAAGSPGRREELRRRARPLPRRSSRPRAQSSTRAVARTSSASAFSFDASARTRADVEIERARPCEAPACRDRLGSACDRSLHASARGVVAGRTSAKISSARMTTRVLG